MNTKHLTRKIRLEIDFFKTLRREEMLFIALKEINSFIFFYISLFACISLNNYCNFQKQISISTHTHNLTTKRSHSNSNNLAVGPLFVAQFTLLLSKFEVHKVSLRETNPKFVIP